MKKTFTKCLLIFFKRSALAVTFTLGLVSVGVSQNRMFDPQGIKAEVSDSLYMKVQQYSTAPLDHDGSISLPGKSQDYSPVEGSPEEWTHTANSVYEYNSKGRLLNRYFLDPTTNDTLSKNTTTYTSLGYYTGSTVERHIDGVWRIISGNKLNSIFDDNGKSIGYTSSYYKDSIWVNSDSSVYQYNNAGKRIKTDSFKWENGVWVQSYMDTTIYRSNPDVVEIQWFGWDGTAWNIRGKNIFTYANPEKPSSRYEYMHYTEYEYIYYDNNQIVSRTKESDIIYDEQDRRLSFNRYSFIDNNWTLVSRLHYSYDENGGHVGTYELFNATTNTWDLDTRSTISFDNHKRFIGHITEAYRNQQWSILYGNQYITTYNDNDDLEELIFKQWDSQNNTLKNIRREVYSDFQYLEVTGVANNSTKLKVNAFPNPTTGLLTIQGDKIEKSQLQVNDLTGRTVFSKELHFGDQHQIDISSLPSGIYLLNLNSKNGVYTSKIVKN
jgi:hypothetical protein